MSPTFRTRIKDTSYPSVHINGTTAHSICLALSPNSSVQQNLDSLFLWSHGLEIGSTTASCSREPLSTRSEIEDNKWQELPQRDGLARDKHHHPIRCIGPMEGGWFWPIRGVQPRGRQRGRRGAGLACRQGPFLKWVGSRLGFPHDTTTTMENTYMAYQPRSA